MYEQIHELAEQAWEYAQLNSRNLLTHSVFETYDRKFAELIVKQCGYYADIFEAAGCPVDMDLTETKPSDYIKRQMGFE